MKSKMLALGALALLSTLNPQPSTAAIGTAFTYQGRLDDGASPAGGTYDLQFAVYDDPSGPGLLAGPLTNSAVAVSNGLFTVTLDFGAGVFTGAARWLEIAVRTNGGGEFTTLSPRQPLTPSPYALYAPSAGAATTAATATTVAVNGVANASMQPNAVTTDKIADGSVSTSDLSPTVLSNTFWRLVGNGGTTPGAQFLGTTDNQAFEIKVNGLRTVRLEPNANSPNVIAGHSANLLSNGVWGASIGGGGTAGVPNKVGGNYGTVAGGLANTSSGYSSTVGGGGANTSSGENATVAGGMNNIASGNYSAIGGGNYNLAMGVAATVPGGSNNTAQGSHSLAAGRRARANHAGAFVWADTTEADFASTANNQFLIRGSGGVGIGTNNPQSALHVAGTVTATAFSGNGASLTSLNANSLSSGTVLEPRIDTTVARDSEIVPTVLANDGAGSGLDADRLDGFNSADFWKLGGNSGTIAGTHFLGTTDNQPLEFKVNGARALRLVPHSFSPTVIAGHSNNFVGAGAYGATIGGGGSSSYRNTIYAPYAAITGGEGNNIGTNATQSAIGGGYVNSIGTSSPNATVAGGYVNKVGSSSGYSAIGGGYVNTIGTNSAAGTVAGGSWNNILDNTAYGVIGGGTANNIGNNSRSATITGGEDNNIGPSASQSAIGGGYANSIGTNSAWATVAGGYANKIGSFSGSSAIGGGYVNTIGTNSGSSTVAGGSWNNILDNTACGIIAGGGGNNIGNNSEYAAILGGRNNFATNYALAAGRRAQANHTGAFVWADSTDASFASTANNEFSARAGGGVRLLTPAVLITGAGGEQAYVGADGAGGDIEIGSRNATILNVGFWNSAAGQHMNLYAKTFNPTSDRNAKENFASVNVRAVLEKLAALPLAEWNFKGEAGTRHLGPVAQDFHAAFGLGPTNTSIATVDADGVALAAIQGLNQKLEEQRAENVELQKRLAHLEQLVRQLATKHN